MLFIRPFLANTWKKSGVTGLVSSQTAVKCGHGFKITLSMENWRGGDWDETQNGAHVMRRKGCAMQKQGITLNYLSEYQCFQYLYSSSYPTG